MIEAAKELLEMVKHMPQYALWVLIGLLFYKVVIIGSWFGIARLLIIRAFNFLEKPKTVQMELGGHLIAPEVNQLQILAIFTEVKRHQGDEHRAYIHGSHVNFVAQAVADKINTEKKARV